MKSEERFGAGMLVAGRSLTDQRGISALLSWAAFGNLVLSFIPFSFEFSVFSSLRIFRFYKHVQVMVSMLSDVLLSDALFTPEV